MLLTSGDVRHHDLRISHPCPTAPRQCPKPLISYRPYEIELTTLTMAKANPMYLIVGGAHPHAFLHDRRMVGRNLRQEWGNLSWKADVDTQVSPASHQELQVRAYICSVSDDSLLMENPPRREEASTSQHANSLKQDQPNSSAHGPPTISTVSTSTTQSTSNASPPQNRKHLQNPIPPSRLPTTPTAAVAVTSVPNGNEFLRIQRRIHPRELRVVEAVLTRDDLRHHYGNLLFRRRRALV